MRRRHVVAPLVLGVTALIGLGTPLLGLVGDAHGLRAVFWTIAVLPLAALLLTLALPGRVPDAAGSGRELGRERRKLRAGEQTP